jgi:hypothetical protein
MFEVFALHLNSYFRPPPPPPHAPISLCLPSLPEADALLQIDFLHSFLYALFPSLQYLCFLQICDEWATFAKCFPFLSCKPGVTNYNIWSRIKAKEEDLLCLP